MSLQYQVVQSIPGRIRVRIDPPDLLETVAEAIDTRFTAQSGVHSVCVNVACASLIVVFDPTMVTARSAPHA